MSSQETEDRKGVSLASRVNAFIGALLIADPKDFQMPFNFYYTQADRTLPRESDTRWERNAIAVDFMRRELLQHVAKWSVFYSTSACAVLLVVRLALMKLMA